MKAPPEVRPTPAKLLFINSALPFLVWAAPEAVEAGPKQHGGLGQGQQDARHTWGLYDTEVYLLIIFSSAHQLGDSDCRQVCKVATGDGRGVLAFP